MGDDAKIEQGPSEGKMRLVEGRFGVANINGLYVITERVGRHWIDWRDVSEMGGGHHATYASAKSAALAAHERIDGGES
jgi:hypothetical protein